MKRSKMLSKIASVIINYNEVGSVIKREKALEIAETILQVQEETGMLPPETKATPEDFTNIDFTQEFLDDHDFTVNRWDKEDD